MRAMAGVREDLAEVGWSAEVDNGGILKKLYMEESGEVVETSSEDTFEFREGLELGS